MNIFATFSAHVRDALAALTAEGALRAGLPLERVTVEAPREASHGDLATNAAMILAREAGMNPRALAELLLPRLTALPDVASAAIAGPGFINLTLRAHVWPRVVEAVLAAGEAYGRSDMGGHAKVNVEFVSTNPTGPMHVGHGRGAVFGDALASLLQKAGYAVTREYYINDAGAQVQTLGRSAYLRYREAMGEEVVIGEGLYPGDYLVPVGAALKARYGDGLMDAPMEEWLPICRDMAIAMMMDCIRSDLKALNISFDVYFSERSLHNPVDQVKALIDTLRADGVVYEGVLPKPKGGDDEEWEEREQTLFRATDFGDDVDRPLMKSDGSYTYFASDIAYHKNKYDRGFTTMIDVLGADHGGYVKRMQAAVRAATGGRATLDIKLCQLVRLTRNGEPVRMSKRAGELITLAEVVEEVGVDATRFMMLFRKNDAPLDFDLAKVIEQSKDNAVFYVQYGHARCRSILRRASEQLGALPDGAPDLGLLTAEGEIGLIKALAAYPRLIEAAAEAHEPHRVAFYLHDLASQLHSHWNMGNDSPHLRFIMENDLLLTKARLALVAAIATVLKSGLALLGVSAPDEMR